LTILKKYFLKLIWQIYHKYFLCLNFKCYFKKISLWKDFPS
jgi:hypothetical protein